MKTVLWLVCLIPLLFRTCLSPEKTSDKTVLAKIAGETVYLDEALEGMPKGLGAKDSARYVRDYLNNRIKEILVYNVAEKNVPQTKDIDKMVENYRRSLIVYEYQQQMLNEKFQSELSDEEVKAFYDKNKSRFITNQHLVKGLFLKVPKNAPNLSQIKSWCLKPDTKTLQKIDAYSVQNASIYNYFMEQWTPFDDVLGNIPKFTEDKSGFLRRTHNFEATDSSFCYLLYIDHYILKGEVAPYDFIKPTVISVMLNTRKTDFLNRFEQNLIAKAKEKGELKIYN